MESPGVVSILQRLIQFNTVNPPGNESVAAAWVVSLLQEHGVEAELLEGVTGRGNVVARVRAERPTKRPLMLMGHLDVVSVEPEKWTRNPFGGEIADGFVWGRGALDMKGQDATEIVTMIEAKQRNLAIDRDLILMLTSDEEVGDADCGAEWLWQQHRDKIDAECAINEGGGFQIDLLGKTFFGCSVAEKGASRLRVIARGPAGHASVPVAGTAMAKMAMALQRLSEWRAPVVLCATSIAMFEALRSSLPDQHRAAIDQLLQSPDWSLLDQLPFDNLTRAELSAIVANTAVPTIISGGKQINVIPSEVVAELDGRILPGQTPEQFRQQVQEALGNKVEVVLTSDELALEAAPSGDLYDAVVSTVAEFTPDVPVAPLLLTGGTDAKAIPGIKCYGFFPWASIERTELYTSLIHSHDERIAIEDLDFALKFYLRLVERFCGSA